LRIEINGDNLAARTLIGYVNKLGFAVVRVLPTFTIHLEEEGNDFIVDGVDSDLERRILFHMEDLGTEKFILQRKGGIRSDREIKITYPAGKDELVARSIARAIQESKVSFWNKKLFLLAFLILSAGNLEAQQFVYGRAWDTVNLAAADPGDSTNQAIRVNCIAGCGAGSGATGIQVRNGAGTWTDVGYFGGNLKVPVTPDPITFASAQPVTQSGTWNPVAVTGTFWPTLSSAPASHRLSDGTNFYNALTDTQLRASAVNVSWSAQTVTVTQGTGTNLHTVLDSGTLTSITNTVSSNLAQVGGNTVATDIGDRSNATQRVVRAGTPTIATGQISCANTATQITTARAGRQGLSVTNLGTTDVYIGTSGVTIANGDLLLGLKGASASYDTSATIYCIVSAGTQSISFSEVY
jgi:hypothetical protein